MSQFETATIVKVYLVSAFALFSAPQFCANNFTLGKLNMLYVLAVAHVAMVSRAS